MLLIITSDVSKIVKFCCFMVLINCLAESRRVKRVVGGSAVECGDQLRVASLRDASSGEHLCGATVLTEKFASTAAHCVSLPGVEYFLQLDNFCGEPPRAKVLEIVKHGLYDKYSRAHDIALVRVEQKDLPGLNDSILPEHSFGAGGECTVYGYGVKNVSTKEMSGELLQANVRIISLDECTQTLGPYMAPGVDAGMMCALGNGADTCEGDSGGPLICYGLLEGVSSHGLSCAVPGVPAMYTSVRAHLSWIQRVIRQKARL